MFALLLLTAIGCNRSFHRERADRDAYALVKCGSTDPRWPLEDYTIESDAKSRMYDPGDPDCPGMPVDDPTSHELMHCVDCKEGWRCWDHCGTDTPVESPDWQAFLPRNEEGQVVLDRQAAVELARLHSTNYQQELEDLYLAALDVSLERFQFDVQFFGGNSTFFTVSDPLGGQGSSSSRLATDTSLGMRRTLAAGGQLVVEAANSVVWQFSGADGHSVMTPISFTLLQPLLRGASRAVVLESLTDSERALLANIRQMERFRRGFYAQVVAGRNPGPGPAAGGLGLGTFAPGGGGGVGGFLALLEQQLQIRNQRANVAALRDSFDQINEFYRVGRISRTQVDEILQNLYSSQIDLLSREAGYKEQIDAYLVSLGLPPRLDVGIEDPLLRPFNLIDPELTTIQEGVSRRLAELRNAPSGADLTIPPAVLDEINGQTVASIEMVENDIRTLEAALPARRAGLRRLAQQPELQNDVDPRLVDTAELDRRVVQLQEDLNAVRPKLQATIGVIHYRSGNWPACVAVIEESMQPRAGGEAADWYFLAMAHWRMDQKEQARRWFDRAAGWTDDNDPGNQRLGRLRVEAAELMGLESLLPEALRELDRGENPADLERKRLIQLLSRLSDKLGQMSLVQAGARLDTATLVPIDLDSELAFGIATENRLDWMNARAALVDRWRQVEVVANQLKSDLDITISGEMNPRSDTLASVHNTTGTMRVGLEFDAPLNRMAERNAYRQILIDYQRARREYYRFEDRVSQVLRDTLRSIRLSQLQFELQRAAVRTAITRVDLQRTKLREPAKPGQEGFSLGPTTARELVNSLGSLLREQNNFLNSWVRYDVLRMDLDFDLGTMQLDDQGMWVDPGSIDMADQPVFPQTEEPPIPAGDTSVRSDSPTLAEPLARPTEPPSSSAEASTPPSDSDKIVIRRLPVADLSVASW